MSGIDKDKISVENHPMMKRYINYYKQLKQIKLSYYLCIWNVGSSIFLAPFFTISISRQLSVTPNKHIYGDYSDPKVSKELMKVSTDVTLREARNFELIKSSGVIEGQKPYRAPIYDNYWQTIKGLYRQGILGFYKGNYYRLLTMSCTHRLKITFEWLLKEKFSFFKKMNFLRDWICLSICDIILHPAFMLENRLILQNRLPQFQFYKNFFKFKSRSYNEIYKGLLGHVPKNFLYLCGFYIYYLLPTRDNYILAVISGNIFSYPLLTAFRRIVCESTSIPGLLPLRYLNILHAIFLIRREEGFFRGLYKGFLSHLIGISLWLIIVPGNSLLSFHQNKMIEDEQLFVNDQVFEEIKNRKIQSIKK